MFNWKHLGRDVVLSMIASIITAVGILWKFSPIPNEQQMFVAAVAAEFIGWAVLIFLRRHQCSIPKSNSE